ncbi:DNA polymerase Y family protein [Faecalicatena contorta]|uniref:DNA polymerase Y family protein n=1 Tax=Faecalicatena contorta TaxID=39482 RepID=UPI001F264D17|nr:DNA polymerase IV [Faecalicatena contorta]MCF2555729.1 DNA polymerase IV [Faecalicatena contorta]
MSIIFHIDVNSAYLSWTAVEQLKNGKETDIRTIPAIIGGDQKSRHGVVLAKSVPAKKYGIHTGEPVANAFRKCPNLVMEPPDHRLYSAYSRKLMDFLKTYTPDIEQVSVDECYMDFTGIASRYYSPVTAALEIKDEVKKRFGFTVNIGISSVKVLAKMASDFEKPDKVHTLFPEEIQVKMWPLPVEELYMAGRSSVETLRKLEIRTIGELAQADPKILELHLKSHGRRLWEFANGMDDSEVETSPSEAKGIGNSTTLSRDAVTEEEARKVLLGLAESVGGRLRKAGQKAGMLSVEIKYHNFESCSHQRKLPRPTNSDQVIYHTAVELFRELWNHEPVRLLGIRSSRLTEEGEPEQLSIFDIQFEREKTVTDKKHEKLDKALDKMREKYGENVVIRGSSLDKFS